MATNIYVGNLAFATAAGDLEALFAEHGEVVDVRLITDRDTGRSRGFAFIEMASNDEAEKAVSMLNGIEVDGRQLTVTVARPRNGGGGGRGRPPRS
jgi:RNA recognition motif-containing protein